MKIALCNEVIRELPFAEQCALAAGLGYDGIEIAPFTLDAAPHLLSPARIAEIRRAAQEAGLAISGLHWLLLAPEGMSITSPDPEVRRFTEDTVRRLVDLCAELGGGYVVHGSPGQRMLARGREAEDRANALAYFAAMAEAAEAAGITYLLEPLSPEKTNFIVNVAEAAAIVDEIGSDALRTMIDCNSAGTREDLPVPDLIAHWLPGGKVAHVHYNDPNRRGPGQGAMDFAPITAALRAGGYQGWIGVEPFVYEPDGPACAARAIGYIRGIEAALSQGAGAGPAERS
ncbi:sugar phosphate isomerase/epimerase family protein [Frigidibacter sp. ROC022]|uniref:sugar phosphate isomerase/epimerase family protein n=1 Tax=Frigidibacter sp. ROC022 TaxID=2971796 RepID=UPI00215B5266|nr:sugar phosphate isomerase/epimerase family protein [Frigidibacter sp. ROC022]MCR8723176.1 sugar phosphate isomerase/epimerase [Frigidibacter sp. ROC022]